MHVVWYDKITCLVDRRFQSRKRLHFEGDLGHTHIPDQQTHWWTWSLSVFILLLIAALGIFDWAIDVQKARSTLR